MNYFFRIDLNGPDPEAEPVSAQTVAFAVMLGPLSYVDIHHIKRDNGWENCHSSTC